MAVVDHVKASLTKIQLMKTQRIISYQFISYHIYIYIEIIYTTIYPSKLLPHALVQAHHPETTTSLPDTPLRHLRLQVDTWTVPERREKKAPPERLSRGCGR